MNGVVAAVAHELGELSHELVDAVRRHDLERLEELLAAEFSLNGAAGVLGRDAFLDAAAGPYEIHDFAYDELDPEVYGNTAVCVSRYRQVARLDGRDVSGELHVTDVWVRRDGRWQIVRRHASPAGD